MAFFFAVEFRYRTEIRPDCAPLGLVTGDLVPERDGVAYLCGNQVSENHEMRIRGRSGYQGARRPNATLQTKHLH